MATSPQSSDPTLHSSEVRPAAVLPAFAQIFESEAPFVGRTLRYLGMREADLEDGCQEVFIVVHRRLQEFSGGSVRAWVRQICLFVARNYRRSRARHPETTLEEPPEVATSPKQYAITEQNQLRLRLLAVIDALPDEQRDIFVLYEIEQLTMAEVAKAVGCPLQTAYSRLHAGRTRWKKAPHE